MRCLKKTKKKRQFFTHEIKVNVCLMCCIQFKFKVLHLAPRFLEPPPHSPQCFDLWCEESRLANCSVPAEEEVM